MTASTVPPLSPEARQLLEATRELIREPEHWTTGELARTAKRQGKKVSPVDDRATCWCLEGALYKSAGGTSDLYGHAPSDEAWRAIVRVNGLLYPILNPSETNDRRGHAAVMRVLALALGESDPEAPS